MRLDPGAVGRPVCLLASLLVRCKSLLIDCKSFPIASRCFPLGSWRFPLRLGWKNANLCVWTPVPFVGLSVS